MEKIKSFQDLNAWKESHKLVLIIYKSSGKFPAEEKFGLTNQIRRASISITSNIAEGFGRKSAMDKKHFYLMAKTSLAEVQNQLITVKDLSYIEKNKFEEIYEQTTTSDRLISGLMKSATSHT
jgi:four helix bundle protein